MKAPFSFPGILSSKTSLLASPKGSYRHHLLPLLMIHGICPSHSVGKQSLLKVSPFWYHQKWYACKYMVKVPLLSWFSQGPYTLVHACWTAWYWWDWICSSELVACWATNSCLTDPFILAMLWSSTNDFGYMSNTSGSPGGPRVWDDQMVQNNLEFQEDHLQVGQEDLQGHHQAHSEG